MASATGGWHNAPVLGQAPEEPTAIAATGGDYVTALPPLGWIDLTALAVLLVFCVLGLFKGLLWQSSRIAILLAGYALAARYGAVVGGWLAMLRDPGQAPDDLPPETLLYLAYLLVFLAVVVLLSLLVLLLQQLVAKAGLTFFDRLGGAAFGVATGAAVVVLLLSVLNMFFQHSPIAEAASRSHSLRWSQRAIDWCGTRVPDELRQVFQLRPLRPPPGPLDVEPDGPGTATEPLDEPGTGAGQKRPTTGDTPIADPRTPPGARPRRGV